MRVLAVLARIENKPVELCAQIFQCHRNTIRNWILMFNENGVEGLADHPRFGRPRKMAYGVFEQIIESPPSSEGLLRQGWTLTLLWHILRENYHISYSKGHLSHLLQQLRINAIVPRSENLHANPQDQYHWWNTIGDPLLKHHFSTLWIEDETTARITTDVKKVLAKKGSKPFVQTEIGRYGIKVNIFISWKPLTGEIVVSLENHLNSTITRKHLYQLKRVHGKGRIDLLWDGSGAHHAQNVKKCGNKKGFHLTFFPPYSPKMNPVEEINRQLKQYLALKLFSSREALVQEITQFFQDHRYQFLLDVKKYLHVMKP